MSVLSLFYRLFARRKPSAPFPGLLPGPDSLFDALAAARAGCDYTDEDRRRDFRAVLFGTSAGRRVLYEILAWSHLFASTFVPGDACATHWREGGRDVGLRILAALAPETPSVQSDQADDGAEAPETGDRP